MKTKLIIVFTMIAMITISCNSDKKKNKDTLTNSITEKHWQLKTLEGQEVAKADNLEREIFITLNTDTNSVTGFTGCNTISGEFILKEGNRIEFKKMLTTLKMCPDTAVNESELLKIFEIADNYTIKDNILSLNVGRRAPLAVFEAIE
ncbi:META domain-containing protein [Polaribacter undariae]|uniref:META domain-containing protein n=1 Tax=Polaribacter sejongensis TaxID=985043 RepID=A0AAJ1QYJ6_9FLAO|nr:META domain-containing protein [Polaribacter undariae]MDN3619981.1 META domain-containing protein [Polaribacter undariae]UWD31741.1 META domain-containing protein [Polaribacter undariae]